MLMCATLGVLGVSVTDGRGVWKAFCRAGRPTERDLRKPAEQSHFFIMLGGDMRGAIMYPPSYHPAHVTEMSWYLSTDAYWTRVVLRLPIFPKSPDFEITILGKKEIGSFVI